MATIINKTGNKNEPQSVGEGEFKQNCGFKGFVYGLLIFSLILGLSRGVNTYLDVSNDLNCRNCTGTIIIPISIIS
ncbi:hypothetical protein BEH94_10225 [Candidatus Altiarchaeales archaeon WOR_SM1_SCG]|nr:hypothetical protein BEH94_10225 [Candidatus Altiarchaeales archaeon WOR_SM1_SCG]